MTRESRTEAENVRKDAERIRSELAAQLDESRSATARAAAAATTAQEQLARVRVQRQQLSAEAARLKREAETQRRVEAARLEISVHSSSVSVSPQGRPFKLHACSTKLADGTTADVQIRFSELDSLRERIVKELSGKHAGTGS